MAKTPPAPVPRDEERAAPTAGKGRPTPSRAEREAARRRPLVPDTKEAKAAAKAELAVKRERARVGMATGDDRYLPARDKGPQRRFVRDWVDARWTLGEWIMPLMLVVIVLGFVPNPTLVMASFLGLWAILLLVIAEMVINATLVKRAARHKFGESRMERGLGWYGAMRSIQMRVLRMPKPQKRRGEKIDLG
ncbi:DUF3043 domain-containing protein [Microbacterium sp.]|uniref:DUF3043 domain-containing protein n=1 Tax=Microbacterium sp. TaxID=51671 RepID=UPI0039E2472B